MGWFWFYDTRLKSNLLPDKFSLTPCILEVARKLGFLGKKGFDIFGKIKLFAPRMKWETLKTIAVRIKDTAKEYETAFNGIKSSVENKDNFKQVGVKVLFLLGHLWENLSIWNRFSICHFCATARRKDGQSCQEAS